MTRHFQPCTGISMPTGCFPILQKEFYTITVQDPDSCQEYETVQRQGPGINLP